MEQYNLKPGGFSLLQRGTTGAVQYPQGQVFGGSAMRARNRSGAMPGRRSGLSHASQGMGVV